ncbi:type II secretion system F family protein [Alteriqipengyuania flavescens]|uniref:type II secretion system F family protein n=1 Tax=Alteriqipengyuania flavescens TaxID=3053610 RepID=UPI0025B2D4C0|nr:type II secretion system F family protein [Alteriqipengyuania flavescens]WJY19657.1 type II secretion system F family protein [Alteriqipengyuania flavescens]WJY25597.1 type II secretion system F family protein [Alteriqipengyuania flavescens]
MDVIATSSAARLAVLLAIFAIVAIVAFTAMAYASKRATMRAGLKTIAGKPTIQTAAGTASLRADERATSWGKLAELIERTGLDLTDTKSDRLREKLVAAGYTSPAAPKIFTLVRLGMIFLIPALYVLLAFSGDDPPSFLRVYIIGALLALLGLYLPNLFVRARADRRREAIINGFPDCLDLILVCVEAGLGIEAALDRVGREMVHSHPLVANLLGVTTLRLRAGATREEAFRKLADMVAVDEIRSFTTLLIQSDKLGTSIASTLRVYAAEMRERRRMRAEEKAHRLPVLISIPLVVFMLPTMIGVLMLPASIRVARDIFPIMQGG